LTKDAGVKDKAKINAVCFELTRMRNQVINKSLDKNTTGLQLLSRYADQIYVLITRIPSSNLDLPVQFTCEDALDKGTLFSAKKASTTQATFVLEHVSTLFNIAALQTQLAADQRMDSDEELKSVAKFLLNAAGIFEHLSLSIGAALSPQSLTPDLTSDVLSGLSTLMVAQAQEMIVKKAIRDRMKDALLAKLCAQTEEMYTETLTKMTKETGKYQWDRAWISNVTAKQLLYSGLAHYFQSIVAGVAKRVGEQICRLNVCIELLRKAQDKLKTNTGSQFLVEANRVVIECKKENDFIYHEVIPDPKSLEPVEKVSSARLAKPTPIPEKFSADFRDIFADLDIEKKETGEAPLKAAIDATIHAAGYYMNKLLSGKKK